MHIIFNNYPTVKMLFLKFNYVLPSSASVVCLFSFCCGILAIICLIGVCKIFIMHLYIPIYYMGWKCMVILVSLIWTNWLNWTINCCEYYRRRDANVVMNVYISSTVLYLHLTCLIIRSWAWYTKCVFTTFVVTYILGLFQLFHLVSYL